LFTSARTRLAGYWTRRSGQLDRTAHDVLDSFLAERLRLTRGGGSPALKSTRLQPDCVPVLCENRPKRDS
jgi:hypothetical protein